MTIEGRLEALAQTVAILGQMQIKTEKSLGALEKSVEALAKENRRFVRFARGILADHETRLLKLEAEEDEDEDKSEGNGQGPSA
jgi:hypothetical protein